MNTRVLYNPKSTAPCAFIPAWLIQIPTKLLSDGAKIVYGRLSQWCNQSGKVHRTIPQLAQETGKSVSSVERALKKLRDVGLIGTYRVTEGGVNHYEFYRHEWMDAEIKKELCYDNNDYQETKSYPQTPPSNVTVPPVKCDGSKIKRNKNNICYKEHLFLGEKLTKETFESFWNIYPVKKRKNRCFELWKKKNLAPISEEIITKVKNQIEKDKSWNEGYIPHPTTYLFEERWLDEVIPHETIFQQNKKPLLINGLHPQAAYNELVRELLVNIRFGYLPPDYKIPPYEQWLSERM